MTVVEVWKRRWLCLCSGRTMSNEPLEVLPPTLRKKLGVRGPQKAPTKERISIRLSREVVERFRESGDGWQTRVDAALREWLKKHSPA